MEENSRRIKNTIWTVTLFFSVFSLGAGFFYPQISAENIDGQADRFSAEVKETPKPQRIRKRKKSSLKSNYSNFPHNAKAHQIKCDSCHKFPSANWKTVKITGDAFPDITEYPRHESCLSCHRQQFFNGNPPQICSICHTNPSPRNNSPRHPFPNPREIFDQSAKAKTHSPDFQIFFPHDKHIDIVSENRSGNSIFQNARFTGKSAVKGEESCAVCHQTYQPQGAEKEEFVTVPPANSGDAFRLKKGTFKTAPISHAKCFECHNADTGILPVQTNCAACHRLQTALPKTDFEPKAAARMKITDLRTLAAWRRRDSSATFRHEFSSHADQECANCHNVLKMNTLDAATKKVPVASCNLCHITATTDDGGALNYEVDERKKNANFACVKCHIAFGKMPVPDSHFEAIKAAQ